MGVFFQSVFLPHILNMLLFLSWNTKLINYCVWFSEENQAESFVWLWNGGQGNFIWNQTQNSTAGSVQPRRTWQILWGIVLFLAHQTAFSSSLKQIWTLSNPIRLLKHLNHLLYFSGMLSMRLQLLTTCKPILWSNVSILIRFSSFFLLGFIVLVFCFFSRANWMRWGRSWRPTLCQSPWDGCGKKKVTEPHWRKAGQI